MGHANHRDTGPQRETGRPQKLLNHGMMVDYLCIFDIKQVQTQKRNLSGPWTVKDKLDGSDFQ